MDPLFIISFYLGFGFNMGGSFLYLHIKEDEKDPKMSETKDVIVVALGTILFWPYMIAGYIKSGYYQKTKSKR